MKVGHRSYSDTPSSSNQPSCSTNKSIKPMPPPTSTPSSTPTSTGKSSKGSGQSQKKSSTTPDLSSQLSKDGKLTNCQGMSKTGSVCDVWVPAELRRIYEGPLKGNGSLLNA